MTVERNGVTYNVSEYSVDFGKAGTARVTVYDPCIDEVARQRRRGTAPPEMRGTDPARFSVKEKHMTAFEFIVILAGCASLAGNFIRILDKLEGRK